MPDQLYTDAYLAAVYDAWHPRHVRDDYDFYFPHIMAAKAVLDVGCGTGTLLREARAAGHTGRLVGLDPAAGMLDRAKARVDVEWVLGDLASAGFVAAFDLIVMTGHAFQVLIEDREVRDALAAVRRALAPGGRFAFETRNPLARAFDRWTPESLATVLGPDGTEVAITTEVVRPYDGRTVTFTHVFTGAHASLPQASRSTLRFLDVDELRGVLQEAGFGIVRQFGDFTGAPLMPSSPEIITFAVVEGTTRA